MKKILPLFFAAALLTSSCSKSDDAQPAATKRMETALDTAWIFQSETTLTTPKNGAASISSVQPISAGDYTLVFYYRMGTVYKTNSSGVSTMGDYTYSGNTLTISYTSNMAATRVQTMTVTELTHTKLVTVENTEDSANRYSTTTTYTR
jgi:hypothetical protein